MKERPILFTGAMVRAILAGGKTQTRRVVDSGRLCKKQLAAGVITTDSDMENGWQRLVPFCPYGLPGSTLWIKETWKPTTAHVGPPETFVRYRADDGRRSVDHTMGGSQSDKWRPSIYMPRWASRITLKVLSVRVERVQEISQEDARAEGVTLPHIGTARELMSHRLAFEALWDSINAKKPCRGWASNPWVWVVEFKVVRS